MPLRAREENGTSRIIGKSGSSGRRTEGSNQHRRVLCSGVCILWEVADPQPLFLVFLR